MFEEPQKEHQWLQSLVGRWLVESECQMGPDQPLTKSRSRVSCTMLGGLWAVIESEGEIPEGGSWKTLMTLGYDPKVQRYVGTFTGSMMTHLFIYSGSLDGKGKRLVLDTEGPRCDQPGLAKYQDIIEMVNQDHMILSSQILGDDGVWRHFMTAHHRREP